MNSESETNTQTEPETLIDGRFHVIERVGESKTPLRYRVRPASEPEDSKSSFLLKIFPKNHANHSPLLTDFDLALLKSLDHPHIAKVIEGGLTKSGQFYLLEEDIWGQNLLEWADSTKPKLNDILTALVQILGALNEIHNHSLLHLQLDHQAVRMTDRGAVIVRHGRLASEFERLERPFELRSRCAAPELAGALLLDRRADYYAFGVLLYRLVNKAWPHENPMSESLQRFEKRFGALKSARALTPEGELFKVLTDSLMSRDPSARPRHAEQIVRSLVDIEASLSKAFVDGSQSSLGFQLPNLAGRRREMALLMNLSSFMTEGNVLESDGLSAMARRATRVIMTGREVYGPEHEGFESLVTLTGPAGLGKQRLLGEFAYRLMARGVDLVWLNGRSLEDSGFHPVRSLIQSLLQRQGALKRAREAPESVRRELLRFVPELITKIPPPASRAEDESLFIGIEESRAERERMIDGLAEFMIREARSRPYCFAITNFELLRTLAKELVAQLARRISTSRRWQSRFTAQQTSVHTKDSLIPLFIITTKTLNDGEATPEPEGDWHRILELDTLRPWEMQRVAAEALGLDFVPTELADWLTRNGAGQPRRVLEGLNWLKAKSVIHGRYGDVKVDIEKLELLNETQESFDIQEALDDCNPHERLILALFALFPRPLSVEFILQTASDDRQAEVESLLQLLKKSWLRRHVDRRLAPASIKRPQLALASLSADQRQALDLRVTAALEESYEQEKSEGLLIELADYARRTQDVPRLQKYALDAADYYERVRSDKRVLTFYQDILAFADLETEAALAVRVRLAACLFRADDIETAIQELESVIEASEEYWPPAPRATLLRRLAGLYLALQNYEQALAALDRGVLLVSDQEDEESAREHAALHCTKGEVMLAQEGPLDDIKRLCEMGQKVLRTKAVTGKGRSFALVRARLLALQGQIEFLRDNIDSAAQLTLGALAVQERYGDVWQAARSCYRLGSIEMTRDREGAAEKHWQRALHIREQYGDRSGVAHILSNMSLSAARLGRLEKAREFILQSLRIREESGDTHGRAAALHNLGYIYAASGALQEAVAVYNECLALREELGDVFYAAWALNNLGHALFILGQTEEARDRLVAALLARRDIEDRQGEAASLARLAEIDYHRGRFAKAMSKAEKAQKIRFEIGGPEELIDSLHVNATIDMGLGRHEKALESSRKAVIWADNHNLQLQLGTSLLIYGRILSHLGRYDKAKSELLRAQRIFETIGDTRSLRCTAMELATVYMCVGLHSDASHLVSQRLLALDPDSAEFDTSLGAGIDRIRELNIQSLLELLHDDGDAEHALSCATKAVELSQKAQLMTLQWRSLRIAAAAFEALGDQDEALAFSAEAQEIVEDLVARVPEDRRVEYLKRRSVDAAIRGDPALESMRRRYLRLGESSLKDEDQSDSPKTLGVTITHPTTPKNPNPSRARRVAHRRGTVHIRALRSRKGPGTEVLRKADMGEEALVRQVELATFVRLNARLLQDNELDKQLLECLEVAVKLCEAERGFMGLMESDGALSIRVAQGMSKEEVLQPQNAFSLAMAQRCLEDGKMIVSDDAPHDPNLRKQSSMLGIGVRSLLTAPFKVVGLKGVLYLDHRVQGGAFNSHRQALAEGLASTMALAVKMHRGKETRKTDSQLDFEVADLNLEEQDVYRLDPFIGPSDFVEELYTRGPVLSESEANLMIVGEPGTGKETLAHTLHAYGPRGREPFVILDCRTVPEELVEAELFGQVEGAFKGAKARSGLLRSAGKGSLVIDGLWDSTPLVQARLLASLRNRSVRPVGSDELLKLEARIIAIAPVNPKSRRWSNVNKDLLAILSEETITLRPLRDRPEDLPFAIQDVLEDMSMTHEVPIKPLDQEAMDLLLKHRWPGNYRELELVLKHAWSNAGGRSVIRCQDLPDLAQTAEECRPVNLEDSLNLDEVVKSSQRAAIERALKLSGDRTEAAKLLGIKRRKLNRLIKRLGILPK